LNGNPDLFHLLVERYNSQVAAVVKGMLGNCPEAEDVGQEAFIRLYNSLSDFRGDAALKTYLVRIAMNLSLNELKRRKRVRSNTLYIDSGATINQDAGITRAEQTDIMEMIYKAMEKLDAKQRSVFTLRVVEGYSTKETAKILKIPLGTVLSRLARAQEVMRGLVSR
jgi:RNA polymerase sigma-70 factor (ECF subfamily)